MKIHSLIFYLILLSFSNFAQQLPTNYLFEANLLKLDELNSNFHSSIKPTYIHEFGNYFNIDSINQERTTFNLPSIKNILLLPLVHSAIGIETNESKSLFNAGVGLQLNYDPIKKLSTSVYYQTNILNPPSYIRNQILTTGIIPQEGLAKLNNENIQHANFGGYLYYTPNDIFNFEIGHGKNHWGSGYRSLLLSDASINYSYAKITTTIWKIKYVNLYANFQDINNPFEQSFWSGDNKFGSFHYLSWNAGKRWSLGFFENVMWGGRDSLVHRGFDPNYLNPVIFFRPVEYAVGSSDNSLLGLDLSFKISNDIKLYGQLVLDEFLLREVRTDLLVKLGLKDKSVQHGWWGNKQGFQIGAKWNNIGNCKNLYSILEFNTIRPYTYAHVSGLSNYGHLNTPLAHPYGANFKEMLWMLNFQKKNWNISFKHIYAVRGLDNDSSNFGGNIYKPYSQRESEFFNYTGQGVKSVMNYSNITFAYILNPLNMLHAFASITQRYELLPNEKLYRTFLTLGVKTGLHNTYHDF